MKKIYRKALLVAAVFSSVLASAQDINLSKKVKDNNDGTYTLTLESYITGETMKQPVDIVLVLDNSNSMYGYDDAASAAALKSAVKNFLTELYEQSEGVEHQVAIVKFQGGGRRIDKYLTIDPDNLRANDICGRWIKMTSDDIGYAKDKIDDLHSGQNPPDGEKYTTGTPAADGLYLARQLLSEEKIKTDGKEKVVIFFTDGCCGTGEAWGVKSGNYNKTPASGHDDDWGYNNETPIPNRYYAQKVVEEANKLKQNGITVFAVGCFRAWSTWNPNGTGRNATNAEQAAQMADTYYYLRHVSSKYSSSIRVDGNIPTTSSGVIDESEHPSSVDSDYDYMKPFVNVEGENSDEKSTSLEGEQYVYATNNTSGDLIDKFESILQIITTAPDLDGETAVVLDAMSSKFRLLADTYSNPVEKVKLYTCSATSATPSWAATGAEGGKTVHKDADNNIISTGGIPEYWEPFTGSIAVNPAQSVAGTIVSDVVQVSGFNFKENFVGDHKDGTYGKKLIIQFDIMPEPSNPGGIDDMKTNDSKSGIYVKQDDGTYAPLKNFEEPNVYLPYIKINKAGLEPGESAAFKVTGPNGYAATVIVTKTDANDPYAILKLVYTGEYTVEELDWAWANDSDSQTVTIATTEYTDASDNPYINVNFKKGTASEVEHDESYVENNMSVNRIVGDTK